jgi:hypothetical protein
MSFLQFTRKITVGSSLLLVILVVLLGITMQASAATNASLQRNNQANATANHVPFNPEVQRLRQMVHEGRLASTVHVLNTFPGTTILQFPLVPSGIKASFPNASGLVTIVQGDGTNSSSDTVTLDVQNMPPNITFTIFFIQFAGKPFGNVEYVADLTTRGDGSGETVFQLITLVAFAMDARNPGTSVDNKQGLSSGTNLEHMGMWFSSLQDAQTALNDDTLAGTIFDGGNPPLHAGPQAMTDGQTAPVF